MAASDPPAAVNPATSAAGLSRREIALWTLAAVLAFLVGLRLLDLKSRLASDGFQYLSVVENLHAGRGIATSLVHFDVERAHGAMPAPLTTFPPGYALATWAVRATGVSGETAAGAVAVAASALSVALLGFISNLLGFGVWRGRVTLLAFAGNANTILYAGAPMSEALFTTMVVAALAGLVWAETSRARHAPLGYVAAGLALGAAYWVRYAGLLMVAGAAAALGLLWLLRRTLRAFMAAVLTVGPAVLVMLPAFVRNRHLTGSLRGGNNKVTHHALGEVARDTAAAVQQLLLGDAASRPARALQAVVLLLLVLGFVFWRRRPRHAGVVIAGVMAAVYAGLMFYLGLTSVISYAARMFLPIFPLVLVVLVAVLHPRELTSRGQHLLLAGAAAYLACAPYTLLGRKNRMLNRDLAEHFELPTADGQPLRAWLGGHLSPEEPVLAVNGQATGYVLHRPAVSLLESEYSDTAWDEAAVEGTMDRFHARFLVLYARAPEPLTVVQRESPFLAGLVEGRSEPHFRTAARNSDVIVLERIR